MGGKGGEWERGERVVRGGGEGKGGRGRRKRGEYNESGRGGLI